MYKEIFTNLVKSVKGDEDMLVLIEDQMNNLASYVNAVYTMEVQMQTLRFRLDGDAYRDAVINLDKSRRNAHEAAIAGCSIINRVAAMVGATVLYDGDIEDRNQVAEFCIAIVDELFHGRPKCSVRELVETP